MLGLRAVVAMEKCSASRHHRGISTASDRAVVQSAEHVPVPTSIEPHLYRGSVWLNGSARLCCSSGGVEVLCWLQFFPVPKLRPTPWGWVFGVSLAFAMTLLVMMFAIGHISGCHINPAVSCGLWASGRFRAAELLPYLAAQMLGGLIAGGLIYAIASGRPGFDLSGSNPLATNGFGAHSPGCYGLISALVIEVVLTFIFLLVILGATHHKAPAGFAGVPIGLSLTLIHLISIPVPNTSVNPARSTGVALWAGGVRPSVSCGCSG